MSDNSTLPVSVGTEVFANNDVSGVKYPRVKATWGPAGSAPNDTDVASGKPMPVQLRGSDGTDRSNLLPVSQSGTWTVQPGNTANTTAWKVDGSAVTQPVSGTVTANVGTGTQPVAGDVAAGGSDSGNPQKIGGQARTTNPTAVTDGQRSNVITDKLGKLIAVSAIRDLKAIAQAPVSNTTSETTILAGVTSTFLDIYGLILANTGATATTVTIKDSTGGTTRAKIYVPAGDTRGFMLDAGSAIPQATVNTTWTATCSAATTALEVTIFYVKNI